MKKIISIFIIAASISILASCGNNNQPTATSTPAKSPEPTATTHNNGGNAVGNAVEDTGDAVGNAAKDAGNAVGDAVEGIGDAAGELVGGEKKNNQ